MFLNKLKQLFLIVTIISSLILVYNWYKTFEFKNNPLSKDIKKQIFLKQKELEFLTKKKFGISKKIPIRISDKMPSKLFGAATFSKDEKITIYLNKNRFHESTSYMIEDVLPHEYAHALMFSIGNFSKQNGGHTKKWQNICKALNGKRCNRFVNHDDIIIGKTNFFD